MSRRRKTKRKRHSKKRQAHKISSHKTDSGFDFGLQMNIASVADVDFNQALREAEIIGCAYGYHPVANISLPVPSITLVGTNSSSFEKAYQHFSLWGCEEDGDVVDVDLLLRSDGTYDLWIGPEINRSLYRTVPESNLFDIVSMNVSWVKHLDSTHEMVHNLKRYCSSILAPVIISAAVIDNPKDITNPQLEPVSGWKDILKFRLGFIEQSEAPLDLRFALINEQPSRKKDFPEPKITPEGICLKRIKTLDTAFPVSRERVRRSSLYHQVQKQAGFEEVTETQVIQGAINLMLSNELVVGSKHYSEVTGNVYKKIWDIIISRGEEANGDCQPADQNPVDVARQIELDVRETLKTVKIRGWQKPFPRLQEFFLKKGYVND